jgi:hypothetical protein
MLVSFPGAVSLALWHRVALIWMAPHVSSTSFASHLWPIGMNHLVLHSHHFPTSDGSSAPPMVSMEIPVTIATQPPSVLVAPLINCIKQLNVMDLPHLMVVPSSTLEPGLTAMGLDHFEIVFIPSSVCLVPSVT